MPGHVRRKLHQLSFRKTNIPEQGNACRINIGSAFSCFRSYKPQKKTKTGPIQPLSFRYDKIFSQTLFVRLDRLSFVTSQALSLFDWQLLHRANGHPEIAYQSVMNTIYPAMHRQWLPPIPRILNDRRLTDIRNRLDNIQLTQTIIFHPWRKRIPEILFMLLMDILNMTQPVIRQTDRCFIMAT